MKHRRYGAFGRLLHPVGDILRVLLISWHGMNQLYLEILLLVSCFAAARHCFQACGSTISHNQVILRCASTKEASLWSVGRTLRGKLECVLLREQGAISKLQRNFNILHCKPKT
jgi:hypothetical protein